MYMSLTDYPTGRVLSWAIQCLCIAQMMSVVYLTNTQGRVMRKLSRAIIWGTRRSVIESCGDLMIRSNYARPDSESE